MSEPETPLHPLPDEQIDLSKVRELGEHDIDDLDLNPDLEASEDFTNIGQELNPINEEGGFKRRYAEDDDMGNIYDEMDDFKPRINIDSPFSSGTVIANPRPSLGRPVSTQRRLSLSQQSKFISHCDERLLGIQRKYVQSRGLNTQNGYSGLEPLLQDLKSLVDFIWYSIEGTPNTDYLLNEDPSDAEKDQMTMESNSTYFGQSAYLIRIADDLLDYVDKFDLESLPTEKQTSTLSKLFKLLFILDRIFTRLLEGLTPGSRRMSGTEAVRFTAIAERTRAMMPRYLEQQGIHGYHYEVSKVYEQALESCGN